VDGTRVGVHDPSSSISDPKTGRAKLPSIGLGRRTQHSEPQFAIGEFAATALALDREKKSELEYFYGGRNQGDQGVDRG